MRSSTASRTPASRRVACDAPSSALAAQRERHQRRAGRPRHRQPRRDRVLRRQRDAERKALLADGDRRELALGRGEDARGRGDAQPPPADGRARLEADRGAACRTRTRRRGARPRRDRSTAPMWASARAAARRDHLRRGAVPDARRGRRRDDGRVERQRDEHGGRAGPLVAVSRRIDELPGLAAHGDREAIALIGHARDVRDAGLRLVAQGRPERRRHRLGAGTRRRSRRRARAKAAAAIRPNSRVGLMRPRPGSRISSDPIAPGRIVPVDCRPALCTARCWPPASRSAPRRAVATSISAAPPTAGTGILWQATFEPGDLSEWLGDGNGGIYMDSLAGAPAASQDKAHRGAFSGIATFSPTVVTSFSYLFREQPSPPEAYYGAWFFIPAALQVRSWLSLHHFGYHRTAGAEITPLWDFNVYPGPDGNADRPPLRLSGHGELRPGEPDPGPGGAVGPLRDLLPQGDATRRGASRSGRTASRSSTTRTWSTAPTDLLQWDAGGGSNDIAPSPAAVYFDDATISSDARRCGTMTTGPGRARRAD